MLIFALLACPSETVEPELETIEIQAFRWSWGNETEPVGAAIVGLDYADGSRHLAETDNSGTVSFKVHPKDGPFNVTVLSYDNWPHAMTRLGVVADDTPVEFAFNAKEYELPTVTLSGVAAPRERNTMLEVAVHQPDLQSAWDGKGDRWSVGVLPDKAYTLLAAEYELNPGARHGEYTQYVHGWYRFQRDAMTEDGFMRMDLDKRVQSRSGAGNMFITDDFAGPLGTIEGAVYSESSAYHESCAFVTLASRHHERDAWNWVMEWTPPTLTDEDLLTELTATAPGFKTTAVRHTTPDTIGNLDMLPAPVLDAELTAPTDFNFRAVPADARAVALLVPLDAPDTVLWMIEGRMGAKTIVAPEPMDADLLPDIDLAVQPALLRRAAVDPYRNYDMAWGQLEEAHVGWDHGPNE